MPRVLPALAHLALWAGLYVVGAAICLAQLAGLDSLFTAPAAWRAALFTFCTAVAVYLLDRAKLTDSRFDPADARAHPARYAFVTRHAAPIRALIVALLCVAAYLGSLLINWGGVPFGAAIPLIAVLGVLLYAGGPRRARPRPKDLLLLKNTYVALGIAGFATIVSVSATTERGGSLADFARTLAAHTLPLACSAAHLVIRVFADAALCDLDDEDADRHYGTDTLATHLGRRRAWNTALTIRLLLAAAIALTPLFPTTARLAWATVTVISSTALRLAAPAHLRDWVDARLFVEALAVAIILALGPAPPP
ncbi:MAG TPA: hypothetical protein VG797_09790 [Phycisphaerales bacterium]|nr:hypothetical protein [Phycisphaerales bacterium]